ncbi:polyisoprenoid-binding protein [Pseudoxanthomonas sp. CAU 1598]|uniref:Polyisoprenoid-binding protein n=2 Tax=Pseudomarimonas arenosa TaxID=2774145 RepID=A0AAW3ZJI4_9GAMM|nr:polyisoprenoid-binding protein [Pseudomarimonas arenosa]
MKALFAALSLGLAFTAQAETYQIDPNHTQVRFQYSHFGLSTIVGLFTGVSGEVSYDPADPSAASVKASIPLAKVNTGVADLDQHLGSADFFDTAKFPNAEFASSKVEAVGDNQLKVTGTLKLRDVEQQVVLNVQLNALKNHPMSGRPAIGFDASTELKRTELGVGKYAPNVSDEVKIEITVEATVPKA